MEKFIWIISIESREICTNIGQGSSNLKTKFCLDLLPPSFCCPLPQLGIADWMVIWSSHSTYSAYLPQMHLWRHTPRRKVDIRLDLNHSHPTTVFLCHTWRLHLRMNPNVLIQHAHNWVDSILEQLLPTKLQTPKYLDSRYSFTCWSACFVVYVTRCFLEDYWNSSNFVKFRALSWLTSLITCVKNCFDFRIQVNCMVSQDSQRVCCSDNAGWSSIVA